MIADEDLVREWQRGSAGAARGEANRFYSGKKKMHTLKSQVAVDGQTGEIVDIPASVRGPTADITLLKESGLLGRLPPECSVGADLGYPGLPDLHPHGHVPRRKPRGKPRPRKIASTIPPSPATGSSLNTPLAACAATLL